MPLKVDFGAREAAEEICECFANAAELNGMPAMTATMRSEQMRAGIGRMIQVHIYKAIQEWIEADKDTRDAFLSQEYYRARSESVSKGSPDRS